MTQTRTPNQTPAVRCRTCGHPVPVVSGQTSFCPHCGRRLRRRMPLPRLIVLGLVAFGITRVYHHPGRAALPPVGPVAAMLADAQATRLTLAADLDRRADDVRAARDALAAQSAELTNLSDRVTQAVARASDEDRWPAKVAGRSLQRADADALLAKIDSVVRAERPAIAHDTAALDGITAASAAVHSDLADIDRLRQELTTETTPERRSEIDRQAQDYRDASAHLPDAPGLTADPTRPSDENTLLR
jgi:predicted RNA-binding Zn-ribbon protein involved in translation (DUF1610 family)